MSDRSLGGLSDLDGVGAAADARDGGDSDRRDPKDSPSSSLGLAFSVPATGTPNGGTASGSTVDDGTDRNNEGDEGCDCEEEEENEPPPKGRRSHSPENDSTISPSEEEEETEGGTAELTEGPKSIAMTTAALSCAMLVQSFLLVGVFTYSGFLAIHLVPSLNEETAGTYAGLIASSFMVGRLLTSFSWGKAADRHGRAFVIKASLLLSAVFSVLFGLAPTLPLALAARFALGLSNGLMGPIKTVITEMSHGDRMRETKAMGIVTGMWGLGFLVSPALSGYLADPVKQYPDSESVEILDSILNLTANPFLLPNLIGTIFCLLTYFFVRAFVEETLPVDKIEPFGWRSLIPSFCTSTAPGGSTILRTVSSWGLFKHLHRSRSEVADTTAPQITCPPGVWVDAKKEPSENGVATDSPDTCGDVETAGVWVDADTDLSANGVATGSADTCGDVENAGVWVDADTDLSANGVATTGSADTCDDVEIAFVDTVMDACGAEDEANGGEHEDDGTPLPSWVKPSPSTSVLTTLSTRSSASNSSATVDPTVSRNEDEDEEGKPATIKSLMQRPLTRKHLLVYWAYSFIIIAVDETFPLYCISKASGLGVEEKVIGNLLSGTGALYVIIQFFLLTGLVHRFGFYKSMRIGALFSVLLLLLFPLSLLTNRGAMDGAVTWGTIALLCIVYAVLRSCASVTYLTLTMTTNRTVPAHQRAAMNGLSMLGGSLVKAAGPAFAGMLFSALISSVIPPFGSVVMWTIIACLGLCVFVQTLLLPELEVQDSRCDVQSQTPEESASVVAEESGNSAESRDR